MTRSSRRRFALLAMLGVLFAQFSLLSYACPMGQIPSDDSVVAAKPDCAEMNFVAVDANLCGLHCQDALKVIVQVDVAEPHAAVPVYAIAPVAPTRAPDASPRVAETHFALANAPPLAVRFCRFLI